MRSEWRTIELSADHPLRVEHRVLRVHGDLVLRGVADEALRVGEGDVRRRRPVSLVVRDDLDLPVQVDADTGVRRSQIDPDRWRLP